MLFWSFFDVFLVIEKSDRKNFLVEPPPFLDVHGTPLVFSTIIIHFLNLPALLAVNDIMFVALSYFTGDFTELKAVVMSAIEETETASSLSASNHDTQVQKSLDKEPETMSADEVPASLPNGHATDPEV